MIQVTGCRILLKPQSVTEHDKVVASAVAAGIKLIEQDERKRQTVVDKGTVLQIGPKCHPDYVEGLKEGDLVGFAKFGGKFIKEKDEDLLVINDEDVICIYKENQ